MPNATEIRMERVLALIAWAKTNLGNSDLLLYDKVLRQTVRLWPTLETKTQESYARAATRGILVRRNGAPKDIPEPVIVQSLLFYPEGINTIPV